MWLLSRRCRFLKGDSEFRQRSSIRKGLVGSRARPEHHRKGTLNRHTYQRGPAVLSRVRERERERPCFLPFSCRWTFGVSSHFGNSFGPFAWSLFPGIIHRNTLSRTRQIWVVFFCVGKKGPLFGESVPKERILSSRVYFVLEDRDASRPWKVSLAHHSRSTICFQQCLSHGTLRSSLEHVAKLEHGTLEYLSRSNLSR